MVATADRHKQARQLYEVHLNNKNSRWKQSKHSTHHIVLVSSTCTKGVSYAQIHVHGVTGASRILVVGRDVPSRLLVTTHSGIKY